MDDNPYQPDASGLDNAESSEEKPAGSVLRDKARNAFRISTVIFFFAAIFNYAFFDYSYIAGRYANDLVALLRGVNVVAVLLLFTGLFSFAFTVLDRTVQRISRVAMKEDSMAWITIFRYSLLRLPYFAVGGSVLWCVWVIVFYAFDARDMMTATVFSVLGNLLAAAWYLPMLREMFIAWYSTCELKAD